MAFEPLPNEFNFLGFVLWGDIAGMTTYRTKRGKVVWLAKTWPKKPPSPRQAYQRAIWSAAALEWKLLTDAERRQWELASRRASLCCTGYNLWIYYQMNAATDVIRTIERQTKTILLPVNGSSSSSSSG